MRKIERIIYILVLSTILSLYFSVAYANSTTILRDLFFSKSVQDYASWSDSVKYKVDKPVRIRLQWEQKNIERSLKWRDILIYKPIDNSLSKRKAIIIFPGGSYYYLAMRGEGKKVAKYLASKGYVAIVLRYSIGYFGAKYPQQLECYRKALDYIKSHSLDLNIDTTNIGVLGFSAGGHLAGCTIFEEDYYKPSFVGMVYPVITMAKPYSHKDSKKYLLRGNKLLEEHLSLEMRVGEVARKQKLPPIYIIHCQNDPVVDIRGTYDFIDTLNRYKVDNFVYKIYKTGGHGFGINALKTSDVYKWENDFITWIKNL